MTTATTLPFSRLRTVGDVISITAYLTDATDFAGSRIGVLVRP